MTNKHGAKARAVRVVIQGNSGQMREPLNPAAHTPGQTKAAWAWVCDEPGVAPGATRQGFATAKARGREHDAVAVGDAVEQLHGREGAGKIVDENVAEIVGV